MIHAQTQALVREQCTIKKQRKFADVVMLKFVRFAVKRTFKISILYHGEQQTFWDGTQDGIVNIQGFLSGNVCERLEFDSRQVTASETSPVFQHRSVSQPYGGVRPDAPDQ